MTTYQSVAVLDGAAHREVYMRIMRDKSISTYTLLVSFLVAVGYTLWVCLSPDVTVLGIAILLWVAVAVQLGRAIHKVRRAVRTIVNRNMQQLGQQSSTSALTFSAEGIQAKSPYLEKSFSYSDVTDYSESRHYFIILVQDQRILLADKRQLDLPGFRQFFGQRVADARNQQMP